MVYLPAVGNWYQFRPSYQWSGFRVARPEVIRHYTGLLNKLRVPYAWQVEGRTLPVNVSIRIWKHWLPDVPRKAGARK
ncbi:hypothetical protein C825_000106 [Parabacteroides sp. ASF519]|uniref:hypothetical protein n=1 Tax=Parabacteroides sp. ASF519 TaxID=1235803 RepID=UPI00202CFF5E|nr:hypothetical protein [Parabacteroides sp. ASF519]KAI4358084.1 hypothetical protein C825_000106 [Parabacteroides sp. ASF519]